MNVDATITTKEIRKVEINPINVIQKMKIEWIQSLKLKFNFALSVSNHTTHINSDGIWEYWENGHGSGYTFLSRAATPEEIEIYHSFKTLLSLDCFK